MKIGMVTRDKYF